MSDTPTPRWTQEEIDDIKQKAAERMRRLGLAPSAPPASAPHEEKAEDADTRVDVFPSDRALGSTASGNEAK